VAVNIRRAIATDAATIAGIHVRAWQWAYRGLIPDAFLDSLSVEARETSWRRQLERTATRVARDPKIHCLHPRWSPPAAHAQKFASGLSRGADRAAKFHELKQRAAAESKTATVHSHALTTTKAKPQGLGAISSLFGIQPASH
jgi:hypothetical protein